MRTTRCAKNSRISRETQESHVNDLKAEQLSEEIFYNEFIARFQEFRELVMKLTSGICVPELNKMVEVMDEMKVINKFQRRNFDKIR
jgi:hypothetical protein